MGHHNTQRDGSMKCPRCIRLFLESKRILGSDSADEVEIDYCTNCLGIWFDAGELTQILRSAEPDLHVPIGAVSANMPCPRCAAGLNRFVYPATYVDVDGCSTCGGLWLDGGEMREIYMVRHSQGFSRQRKDHAGLFLRWLRAIRSTIGMR
jgi:Zn-finger nucleic acid-binding protein